MELFIAVISLFLSALAAVIRAVAPIVTTTITENAQTERMKISSGEDFNERTAKQKHEPNTTDGISKSTFSKRIGLTCILLSSSHLALLQFSSGNEAALSVGSAAAIAQAFGLLLMGIWLLFER